MKTITKDELTEVMNELDNKTKELSSREISEKFSKEFFSLLTVADFATLGKTKALIYALKLDIWQARTRDNVQTGKSVTALPCCFVGTIYYGLWVQRM